VPVKTVVGYIQCAIGEPRMLNLSRFGVPGIFEAPGRFFEPAKAFCLFQPETVRVVYRLLPHLLILLLAVDMGIIHDISRWRKSSPLGH